MLFKRRNAITFQDKARNLVWPKMGWKRVANYYKFRTIRIPDSEYSVALGLAFGCAVSWTPTFGTHLLQCALFSWLTKSNWIAAFIGSAFGNPWTTPALMLVSYHVGKALFTATGHGDIIAVDADSETFGTFLKSMVDGSISWHQVKGNFRELLLPTLLGGYTMALATFPLFYFPFYYMVKGARLARKARIESRTHSEAIEITGQAR